MNHPFYYSFFFLRSTCYRFSYWIIKITILTRISEETLLEGKIDLLKKQETRNKITIKLQITMIDHHTTSYFHIDILNYISEPIRLWRVVTHKIMCKSFTYSYVWVRLYHRRVWIVVFWRMQECSSFEPRHNLFYPPWNHL